MKRRTTQMVSAVLAAGIMFVCPGAALSGSLDPYIQAAKTEGAVNIGVTLREKVHGKPAGELYLAAFQKRYPFLKVNFKRIGGTRDRERILTEMTAGLVNFDVVVVNDTMISTLMAAKLPRVAPWEKLGVPAFMVHPDRIGVPMRTATFGIAYNRDLIPDDAAAPFTWETCTDPQWKGKAAMDDLPRFLESFYPDRVWGRAKTLDFARRWAANKPSVENSRSTAASKLMAGAYHFQCGVPRAQVRALQVYAGAKSIGVVFPEPVPSSSGDLIFVPDKARHPNAGILFIAWSGSTEAQNLLDRIDFTGHPGFEGNEVAALLQGRQIATVSWEDIGRSDFVLSEILTAMGMPVVRGKTKKKK